MGNEQGSPAPVEKNTLIPRQQFQLLGDYVPPRTSTEHKLADIWCKVLEVDKIGILDKYEHLGGDSLLAVSLFVEVEDVFGVALPIHCLAEAPTIQQLAQTIDAAVSKVMK